MTAFHWPIRLDSRLNKGWRRNVLNSPHCQRPCIEEPVRSKLHDRLKAKYTFHNVCQTIRPSLRLRNDGSSYIWCVECDLHNGDVVDEFNYYHETANLQNDQFCNPLWFNCVVPLGHHSFSFLIESTREPST